MTTAFMISWRFPPHSLGFSPCVCVYTCLFISCPSVLPTTNGCCYSPLLCPDAGEQVGLMWGEGDPEGGGGDTGSSGPDSPGFLRTAEEAEELVAREVEVRPVLAWRFLTLLAPLLLHLFFVSGGRVLLRSFVPCAASCKAGAGALVALPLQPCTTHASRTCFAAWQIDVSSIVRDTHAPWVFPSLAPVSVVNNHAVHALCFPAGVSTSELVVRNEKEAFPPHSLPTATCLRLLPHRSSVCPRSLPRFVTIRQPFLIFWSSQN